MATTYQLYASEVQTETVGDRTDSICSINWTFIAVSDSRIDNPQLVAEHHDTTIVSSESTSDDNYVSFSNLTDAMVLGWVNADIDSRTAPPRSGDDSVSLRDYIKASLEEEFVQARSSAVGNKLPWIASSL